MITIESMVKAIEKLQEMIDNKQVTSADIARILGVHKATVGRILSGKRGIGIGLMFTMIEKFRMSTEDFKS